MTWRVYSLIIEHSEGSAIPKRNGFSDITIIKVITLPTQQQNIGGEKVIKDKIMEFCKENGISMRELEREAEIKPGTLKTWHKVKNPEKIDAGTIIRLAKVMGQEPEELISE